MEEFLGKNINKEQEEQRPKKFVFQILPEHIDYVEGLSYQQKNELVNKLIYRHRIISAKKNQEREVYDLVKKILFTLIGVVVGIPLLLSIINFSVDATLSSYSDMQKKFEILFSDY